MPTAPVTVVFSGAELTDLDEKLLAPPSATALSGDILTRSAVLFTSPDEKVLAGAWECDPGASRWEFHERGEVIHVLSGRMSVQRDGDDAVD